jgi:hypothetical protein
MTSAVQVSARVDGAASGSARLTGEGATLGST